MAKHRDWTIEKEEPYFYFGAIHNGHEAEFIDGNWHPSYPIFHGSTVQDCIEQIDDWYEENEDV